MELSAQQRKALQLIEGWRAGPEQVFRLFGYAGTGKSTLARYLSGPRTLFAAYTGKAAHELGKKGVHAQTLHSLIYLAAPRSKEVVQALERELQQELERQPQDLDRIKGLQVDLQNEIERHRSPRWTVNPKSALKEADLLVVDEVSMVDKQMGQDILSFEKKVLVLGDPAQLPPVGGGGFFTKQEPDFLLTEVHRQSQDSPVLMLANHVRVGDALDQGRWGQSAVMPKGQLGVADLAAHDQVICGTNATRRRLNAALRAHLGRRSRDPVPGDRVVCLRNNHDLGLLNGSQWVVHAAFSLNEDKVTLQLESEEGDHMDVVAWRHWFDGREDDLRPWQVQEAQAFDYANAITCHKAQGSQWDKVFVVDESTVFGRDHRRWLYTAITRASESVTVVV